MNRPAYANTMIAALLGSVLLSCWFAMNDTVINPDGMCYLLSAQLMGSGSLSDVMHLCPQSKWPLYSGLIYSLSQFSHLSLFASAHIWDGIFSLMSVGTFILLVKEMGGSKPVLWLAAGVILCNHQFNVLRDEIVRDHGFWAFYLGSIYCLMKYFQRPGITTALIWSASMVLAGLFRIEGMVFWLLIPFFLFFNFNLTLKERSKAFALLNTPLLLMIALVGLWQLSHPHPITDKLGRVNEMLNQLQHGWTLLADRYQTAKAGMADYVLPSEGRPDAGVLVLIMLCGWYIFNVVKTLSLSYAALAFYAMRSKAIKIAQPAALVWLGYFLINLAITLGFLAERFFTSKRYLIALTLLLMLWVPFALYDLWIKRANWRHRAFFIITVSLVAISALTSVVHFGRSKDYLYNAGDWVAANVPKQATFYTNDLQLMYYTQRAGTDLFTFFPNFSSGKPVDLPTNQAWKQYAYLAIRVDHHRGKEVLALLQELRDLQPVKIFHNHRDDNVVIYQIGKK